MSSLSALQNANCHCIDEMSDLLSPIGITCTGKEVIISTISCDGQPCERGLFFHSNAAAGQEWHFIPYVISYSTFNGISFKLVTVIDKHGL